MKFYDLMVKRLKIRGLINSFLGLLNDDNKSGIEFNFNGVTNPFLGFDKNSNELIGSNDGVNFFPLYNGEGKPLVVEKNSENGFLTISSSDGFPIGITSPNNTIIPLLKETVTLVEDNYEIELSAYISYSGLSDDSGLWKVHVASGGRGPKGNDGESLKLTVGSVVSGATPSVEIVGESPNQTLNFVLPSVGNNFETVNTSVNNTISVSSYSIPVMLKTNTDKYYNIRGKEITLSDDKTKFIIDISNALAVNNSNSFDGTWVVYFAGGNQVSNVPFSPSTRGVGTINTGNNEIVLDCYLIDSNSINIYCSGNTHGEINVHIYLDEIEIQSKQIEISSSISKNSFNLENKITGNVKIVCDLGDSVSEVKIYKIEA